MRTFHMRQEFFDITMSEAGKGDGKNIKNSHCTGPLLDVLVDTSERDK